MYKNVKCTVTFFSGHSVLCRKLKSDASYFYSVQNKLKITEEVCEIFNFKNLTQS